MVTNAGMLAISSPFPLFPRPGSPVWGWYHPQWVGFPILTNTIKIIPYRHVQKPVSRVTVGFTQFKIKTNHHTLNGDIPGLDVSPNSNWDTFQIKSQNSYTQSTLLKPYDNPNPMPQFLEHGEVFHIVILLKQAHSSFSWACFSLLFCKAQA